MKKSLMIVLIGSIFVIGGCAQDKPAPQKIVKEEYIKKDVVYRKDSMSQEDVENARASEIYNNLPQWVKNNCPIKNGLGAVGVAQRKKYRPMSLVRDIAIANANKNLSNQIKMTVLSNFLHKTKDISEEDKRKFKEEVEESLKISSNNHISGAEPFKSYMSPDGNFYICVIISQDNLERYKMYIEEKIEAKKNKFMQESKE